MNNAKEVVDGFEDARARNSNKKEEYALMRTSISSSGGERLVARFTWENGLHNMTCS